MSSMASVLANYVQLILLHGQFMSSQTCNKRFVPLCEYVPAVVAQCASAVIPISDVIVSLRLRNPHDL